MSETEEKGETPKRSRRGPLSYAAKLEEVRRELLAAKRRDLEKAASMLRDACELMLRASRIMEAVEMRAESSSLADVAARGAALEAKIAESINGEANER